MNKYLISVILLSAVALGITACGGDDETPSPNTVQNDQSGQKSGNEHGNDSGPNGENGSGNPQGNNVAGITVTIDADGHADAGHSFAQIDDTNFYIDGIRYSIFINGITSAKELKVTGYSTDYSVTEVELPARINYKGESLNVVVIDSDAFENCSTLKSMSLPEGIRTIYGEAFYDCRSLISINIPESVTYIYDWAFLGCNSLTSISLPKGLTIITEGVFAECSSLTSITIPEGVTTIRQEAFQGCNGLTSIVIPNQVTYIGQSAFRNCNNLTTITIGNAVNYIGDRAFEVGNNLHDVYCYAENVPETGGFSSDPNFVPNPFHCLLKQATLHVPAASIDTYRNTEPWSGFGQYVAL